MITEAGLPPAIAAPEGGVDRENPWPGLAAFRETDSAFFHGRSAAVEELHRRVRRERLTLLFGLSGLGKTSLLHAGLFPILREENLLPVPVRLDYTGEAPDLVAQVRQALERSAAEAGVEAPARRPGDSLWERLHRPSHELWSPRNRLLTPVFVFDQFEEIFTLGRGRPDLAPAGEAFLAELADLVEGRPPARLRERLDAEPEAAAELDFQRHPFKVLLTLREDFLPELEELRGRMPALTHNRMRLLPMSGEEALAVVTGAGGHLVEPAMAERIVRFVAGARDDRDDRETPLAELTTEPALLSVVCRELNLRRRRRGEARITSDLLEGDRTEILAQFYERGVADLAPEVRRLLEERLLTTSGYRDSVALEDALAVPGVGPDAIERLVTRRLLRIEERGGVARIELTHDVLTGVVRASRDARREREAREAAEAARREAEERERLAAAKLRRSRIVSAVLAASLALALAAGTWAVLAQRSARRAQVSASYQTARSLAEDGADAAAASLAYVASVLRLDPDHEPARYLLDDLLLRRSWTLPRIVLPHDEGVLTALASDDGRVLLTLTRSGAARVWEAETGRPLGEPIRHQERIFHAALSPDGSRVATSDSTGQARLWDAGGRPVGPPIRHDGWITSLLFSPDGRRLLTTSHDRTVRWWDAATGRPAGEPMRHEDWVDLAVLSRDGAVLATASRDGVVKLWDAATGRPVGGPLAAGSGIKDLDLSADGSLALTVSDGGLPLLWDRRTGRVHDHLALPPRGVLTARFSPDGRLLAFGTPEGTAALWDPVNGMPAGPEARHGAEVTSVALGPDGRRLLTVAADDTVRLWDVATGALLGQPMRHGAAVSTARFLGADGRSALTASADGTARVWDLRPARGGGHPLVRAAPPVRPWLDAGGDHVLMLLQSADGLAFRVYDVATGAPRGPGVPLPSWADQVFVAGGGRRALTVIAGLGHLWDTGTGTRVGDPWRHADGLLEEARLGAGDRLAVTRSSTGSVRVWELETGRPVGRALRLGPRVIGADLDPDGERLVTSDAEGTIRLWTLPGMAAVGQPMRHDLPVSLVRFLSDRHLLLGALDGEVWIQDLVTGEATDQPMRHDAQPTLATVSGDGRRLATASLDGAVRVWSLPEGAAAGPPIRLGYQVVSVRLSPDGRTLLTTDFAGPVRLWDVETSEPLGLPVRHGAGERGAADGEPGLSFHEAAFLPDRRGWVTAGTDGAAIVWDSSLDSPDDPEALAELAEAVAGLEVGGDGRLAAAPDPAARLRGLRERAAEGDLPLVRWFLSDPWERTVTPWSELTVEQYLRHRLKAIESVLEALPPDPRGAAERALRAELEVAFPGHPLLRPPGP